MNKHLCYNEARKAMEEADSMEKSAEFYWRIFEQTGSVMAYVFYRNFQVQ